VFLLKGEQLGEAIFAVAALSVLDRGFERGVWSQAQQPALSRLAVRAEGFEDLMRIAAFGTRAASNECHRYGSRWLVRPLM
jgi:hypothetical protein